MLHVIYMTTSLSITLNGSRLVGLINSRETTGSDNGVEKSHTYAAVSKGLQQSN